MGYRPGESGNPAGRPPGVGQVAELKRMLFSQLPEVVNAVIIRALQGDMTAARLILDRTIPQLRPVDGRINVPLANSGDPGDQAAIVVDHLLAGGLAPNIAVQVMQSLVAQQQMVALADLERRILALEENGNGND